MDVKWGRLVAGSDFLRERHGSVAKGTYKHFKNWKKIGLVKDLVTVAIGLDEKKVFMWLVLLFQYTLERET